MKLCLFHFLSSILKSKQGLNTFCHPYCVCVNKFCYALLICVFVLFHQALMNACIDALGVYRTSVANQPQSSGLLAPYSLRLLPLFILAIMKHVCVNSLFNNIHQSPFLVNKILFMLLFCE